MSFPCNLSLVKRSLDDAHLGRERRSAPSRRGRGFCAPSPEVDQTRFQVNDNAWIFPGIKLNVLPVSLRSAQLRPGHPLAFRAAAKVLKNALPGVTVGVPLLFPLRASRQHITGAGDEKEGGGGRWEKKTPCTTNVLHLKQPEDGEAVPPVEGICVTLEAMLSGKALAFKRSSEAPH